MKKEPGLRTGPVKDERTPARETIDAGRREGAAMIGPGEYAERYPRLTDMVIVLALFAGVVIGTNLVGPGDSRPHDIWAANVVMGLACAALVRAREHPRIAVVVATACVVVTGGLGFVLSPLLLAPLMVALYWLAAATPSRTTWVYGGVATVLVIGTAVGVEFDTTVLLRALGPALWLLLPPGDG